MGRINRFAAASALAAALSMAATPALAHDHHWHHWHDHDGISFGDVLAGAAIIGGIAAVASAADKHGSDDHARPSRPVPDERQGYGYGEPIGNQGLDRLADTCVDAVERGRDRVDSVDDISRDRDGWSVSGVLLNGVGFGCRIGDDGRVDVHLAGPRAEAAPPHGDGQFSDDFRAYATPDDQDAQPSPNDRDNAAPPPAGNRPVWGGDEPQPEPQDDGPAQPQDDGRYGTSQTPDFGQAV